MPLSAHIKTQSKGPDPKKTLENLVFMNRYASLPDSFYTRLNPTGFDHPFLVCVNPEAATLLDLDERQAWREEFVDYFCGNKVLPGAEPLSQIYAGHQFGTYVSQLGDGRAHLLGEVVNGKGEKWDVQLKGSGRTPYSRFGDGRAMLRSSIREYLCSEAMHHLGVPTTRALCIVGSDEEIMREDVDKAAMLTRLAPSHVRFGHLEYFFYQGDHAAIQKLTDSLIEDYFPEFSLVEERYSLMFEEIVTRTARLMAHWMAVGFTHGVMNTDNMSLLGLTIDYGPFGFMEAYDPAFVPNHSDTMGRYAFDQQPSIAFWNLHALGNALSPILPIEESAMIVQLFEPVLVEEYARLMRAKLGFHTERAEDMTLLQALLDLMAADKVDYTLFFRTLSTYKARGKNQAIKSLFTNLTDIERWLGFYKERLAHEEETQEVRAERMNKVNPKYILRTYLAEIAIRKAYEGDFSEIERLHAVLRRPFDEQPENKAYAKLAPEWAKDICISCSS